MTTQQHPRPAFVNGPVIGLVALALVGSAAFVAVRFDWQRSDSQPSPESFSLAPSPGVREVSPSEILAAEIAVTEAHWDAAFGPYQRIATVDEEIARAAAEHDRLITETLGVTQSFGTSPGVGTLTDGEVLAAALAEHEAWIAAYIGQ